MWILAVASLLVSLRTASLALKMSSCRERALGMETGEIGDAQLSASSSFDSISVGPQNARIRKELASGAWCPKPQIKVGAYEFLQINLQGLYAITGVETQGRYGNGTGREFPTHYMIDYLRPGSSWIRYKNRNSSLVVDGNEDTSTAVFRTLDPPIIASRIRFVPFSEYARTVCMRVELYGCEYEEGLIFYSMNVEGSRIGDIDLRDGIFENSDMKSTFNGAKKGLGLLTDGVIATSDPLQVPTLTNSSWIGWNRLMTNGSVELIFEFDTIRNFSYLELWLYGNSLRTADVSFSTDGKHFPLSSQISSIQRPRMSESKTPHGALIVPLHSRSGIAVKLILGFSDQWIFLTEIFFSSRRSGAVQTSVNFTFEEPELFNATTFVLIDPPGAIISTLVFAGLVLLFVFVTCVVCGVLVARRRPGHSKGGKKEKGKAKTMIASVGEKGVCTSLYSEAPPAFQELDKERYGFDEDKKWEPIAWNLRNPKSPSWSTFHFPPPPPSDADSVGDHPSSKPLLAAPSSSFSVASPGRVHRERTWPKKKMNEESLHYASSSVSETSQKKAKSVHRVDQRSVQLGVELGEGRFTVVRACRVNEKPFAVKSLRKDCMHARGVLIDEAKLLAQLDHPNVLRLHGTGEDLSLFLELAEFGNIREYFRQRPNISYGELLAINTEIAAGLTYLEQKRVVHGHLSPQCVLVAANSLIKVASPRGRSHHAQLRYSAPESIIANEWSNKSDIWSYAVTAWEIFERCERLPFSNMNNTMLLNNARAIFNGSNGVHLQFGGEVAKQLADLLMESWRRNAAERPTFLEIHYFLSMRNSGPIASEGAIFNHVAHLNS